jgi:glycosyltransferase involved in cell wall biosynthesis
MKILVVGYACDPYRGSEPGVGWTAVCRIAKRHDVWVLTDIHNREGWERGAREGIIPKNVQVRFLMDRNRCSPNRFIAHIQSWLNYASFNRQVLAAAKSWHEEIGFDLCQQVTIAAWRMPSPLWQLPFPFIWGPIGGAGTIPADFRSILSPSARIFELARDASTKITQKSNAFHKCMKHTTLVLAANEETAHFLRPFRGERPIIELPIVSLPEATVSRFRRPDHAHSVSNHLRLFAGGSMIGTKGVNLALRALAQASERGLSFHYTIAGDGPETDSLKALSSRLGISDKVTFHPGFQGQDYINALHQNDVYFLPSLRETMGITLVEAILAGMYPVVADTSAPGEIVRMAGGHTVSINSVEDMVKGLTDALCWCCEYRERLPLLAQEAAKKIAAHFSSDSYDKIIESAYERAVYSQPPRRRNRSEKHPVLPVS